MGLTGFLTLLVGVSLSLNIYERIIRRQSVRVLRQVATAMPRLIEEAGKELDHWLECHTQLSQVAQQIEDRKLPELYALLHQENEGAALDYAQVTDQAGTILADLRDTLSTGTRSPHLFIQEIIKSQEPFHGLLREDHQIYLAAATPLLKGDQVIGVLTIGKILNTETLDRLFQQQDEHCLLWLSLDQPSLADPNFTPLPPLRQVLSKKELTKLSDGAYLVKTLSTPADRLLVVLFPYLLEPARPIYLGIYQSLGYLQEAGRMVRTRLLVILIFLVASMLLCVWWISKQVTNPLLQLSQVTRRLAHLDFSQPITVQGQNEIADLANSIRTMSRQLQHSLAQKDRFAAELTVLNLTLERQVASRTEELARTNHRMRREIAEKDDFLRAISHDLGAPLRNIAGLARLIERKHKDRLGEDAREMLVRITNNVKNELGLIEQLLELSRIKTRRTQPREFSLLELLHEIKADLSFSIEERRAQIRIAEDLPVLFAERNRIRQLFQNLIDNALKYLGKQAAPCLEIDWVPQRKTYMFWVSDNGIGIPADQIEKIFGVFRRVNMKEVRSIEGKGIGLASVKTILQMYGGDVWVESVLGQGSTFYFTLDRDLVNPSSLTSLEPQELEEEANLTS